MLLAGLDVAQVHADELVAVGPLVFVEVADGVPDLVDDAAGAEAVTHVAADGLLATDPADRRHAHVLSQHESDEVLLVEAAP